MKEINLTVTVLMVLSVYLTCNLSHIAFLYYMNVPGR